MTVVLRQYQDELKGSVYAQWQRGLQVVVMRLATGGGKTAIFSSMINEHVGYSCLIAHRDNILIQISLSLARNGVRHNLIASSKLCKKAADLHVSKLGQNFYDPGAKCTVASVDTLIKRPNLEKWAQQVTLWVIDEGHHARGDNKWIRAVRKFSHPSCKGLLPTATPKGADGLGLGKPEIGGDGLADCMVEGPPERWLIDEGYLCDYDVICADSHLTELLGEVGKSGDWSTAQLKAAADASPIVGDVVNTYRLLNTGYYAGHEARPSRSAVVFAPDVETATKMLINYRSHGIAAELMTADTDIVVRTTVFEQMEINRVHVLIAVDIISEGTDMPALQVGIFSRSTASLPLYRQQFGRVLRPLDTPQYKAARSREERLAAIACSSKPRAVIIDHVGNFMRHGPPDRPHPWSLISTSRKNADGGAIPQRVCLNPKCAHPYYRYLKVCPYCQTPAPPPAERGSPAMVDGVMHMLDPAVLKALQGMVSESMMTVEEYQMSLAAKGVPRIGQMAHAKTWATKLETRQAIKLAMERWGGLYHMRGLNDDEIQSVFWHKFGVDVMTAQTLSGSEGEALLAKITLDDGSI